MKKGQSRGIRGGSVCRYFLPGENVALFEKSHGLENEKLGLPIEDLDNATRDAFALSKGLFWANFGKH
jgi:hypothetical protein